MKLSAIKKENNYYSPWKSVYFRKQIDLLKQEGSFAPTCLQVDLEGWCPHSCEFCTYKNVDWTCYNMQFEEPRKLVPEKTGLPKEIALRLPEQICQSGIPSVEITGGGEPLVYPYIKEFLEELGKYPIELAIVTNGSFLHEQIQRRIKNLKWIRFSVDASTAETYSKTHKVASSMFGKVVKHIKEMIERGFKDCKIGISFVITQNNYQEIEKAGHFFKNLGVDNIRYTFTYDADGNGRLTKEETGLSELYINRVRALQDDNFKVFGTMRRLEFYSQPNGDFCFCGYQFFTWAIGYDGLVYPCCIMKYHKDYAFGDLKTHSLQDIIHSPGRNKFITDFNVLHCKPCWLRDKNQFIEYLLTDKPQHINFV